MPTRSNLLYDSPEILFTDVYGDSSLSVSFSGFYYYYY